VPLHLRCAFTPTACLYTYGVPLHLRRAFTPTVCLYTYGVSVLPCCRAAVLLSCSSPMHSRTNTRPLSVPYGAYRAVRRAHSGPGASATRLTGHRVRRRRRPFLADSGAAGDAAGGERDGGARDGPARTA
jgi:hypothetical protein